jgi:hypothetical protein
MCHGTSELIQRFLIRLMQKSIPGLLHRTSLRRRSTARPEIQTLAYLNFDAGHVPVAPQDDANGSSVVSRKYLA